MSITGFEIEVTSRGAIVRYVERPSLEGIRGAAEAMAAHPDFHPVLPTIWDLSAAPDGALGADEMRRLAPLVAGIREGGGRPRVAIVTKSDASFAGARMFSGLNESRMLVELGVFRTLDEAVAWAFGSAPDGGDAS